jgi:hypothetical protein
MIFSLVIAFGFYVAATAGAAGHPAYIAVIDEVVGTNSNVTGMVAVFSDASMVGFSAMLKGLEPSRSDCSAATNGCGIHIHTGTDCFDAASQGGHYFKGDTDPWKDIRYTTNAMGVAYKSEVLEIGTDDLIGRAVVGTQRILCVIFYFALHHVNSHSLFLKLQCILRRALQLVAD